MTQHQHKILSAFIISAVTFLSFEALSFTAGIYELRAYFALAVYIAIFHIFWIGFIFDLHLKHREPVDLTSARYRGLLRQALKQRFQHFLNWRYFKHYINYLILPAILFWSVIILIFLNPFRESMKQIVIIASSFALTVVYWHMKEHVTARLESRMPWLKVLAAVKLFAAFMAFAALFGFVWYFGLSQNFLFYFVLGATFFLIYQALYQYDFHSGTLLFSVLLCSVLIGLAAIWIYRVWSVEYFTAALALLALYNTLWGLIHHYIDRTLTARITFEYIIMAVVVLSIVYATHNFANRLV